MTSKPRFPALHVARAMLRMLFFPAVRLHVLDVEQTAREGAFILACNHISHFDPPLVGSITKRAAEWLAMSELFETKFSNAFMSSIGCIPVNRFGLDRTAIRTARQRLEAGAAVGIFPEGGLRSGADSVLNGADFKPGAAALAAFTRAPILPAVVIGTDRLYNPAAWIPFKRTPVWIAFGSLIEVSTEGQRHEIQEDCHRRLAQAFLRLKKRLMETFPISDEDLPHSPQHRKGREP